MKVKKQSKLDLNKQTVSNLSHEDMANAKGGLVSSNICWAIGSYITGKVVDYLTDTNNYDFEGEAQLAAWEDSTYMSA